MRKPMLLLAVCGLVGSLWAVEPLGVGTWVDRDNDTTTPNATAFCRRMPASTKVLSSVWPSTTGSIRSTASRAASKPDASMT
jgi:hypothetical protein